MVPTLSSSKASKPLVNAVLLAMLILPMQPRLFALLPQVETTVSVSVPVIVAGGIVIGREQ
jgi:hypothetical protein